jgi:hypothetical protein
VTVDDVSTRANEQLAEFRVLLDLTAERLWELQRDFMVLQDEMVKAYALLGALPTERSRHARSSHLRIFVRSDLGVGDAARKGTP